MDGKTLVEYLVVWIQNWRACHPDVPEGVLQGTDLYLFVNDLQNEIKNQIGDFGLNTIDNNAQLILYSGIDYNVVKDYCLLSGNQNYMISQTLSRFL